jgi:hypothetical protein
MTPKLGLVALTVAAALIGCGPSIDPAAKADIDARIATLRARSITIPAPAADTFESMPLAIGQWAQYKMTLPNGESKFLTQKIVGEEGGALLVEIVHDTYQGRTEEQLLVAVGNQRDPGKVELRAVKIRDAKGHLTTLSQTQLWVARTHLGPDNIYWEDAIGVSLVTNWQGTPQSSTAVIAGRFEGCYLRRASRQSWVFDAWSHPSVPLGGLVRKQDNRGFVSELVAYGTSGAQSDL